MTADIVQYHRHSSSFSDFSSRRNNFCWVRSKEALPQQAFIRNKMKPARSFSFFVCVIRRRQRAIEEYVLGIPPGGWQQKATSKPSTSSCGRNVARVGRPHRVLSGPSVDFWRQLFFTVLPTSGATRWTPNRSASCCRGPLAPRNSNFDKSSSFLILSSDLR